MLLQVDYVYHLYGVKQNLPDTGISCHLSVFKDSLIISWHKDIFKDSLIIFWYKDIFLLPQKKIFPPAHLCTRRPHQLQNVGMVVCSSVWPNRKVVKLKIKEKCTSVPPPSPGMVSPLAEGPTPPKPPKRPPNQHRPMPELLSLIMLIKSSFKTTPVWRSSLYFLWPPAEQESLWGCRQGCSHCTDTWQPADTHLQR